MKDGKKCSRGARYSGLKSHDNPRPSQSTGSYESIKLGINAHAQYYRVSRQVDGATPQPVHKMTGARLMLFVVKQQKLARNVGTGYETGASKASLVLMSSG